jgi:hypothetical protein
MGCIHCCIEIVGVGCFGGLEFHQRVIRVRRSIYTIMPQMKDNHCLSCHSFVQVLDQQVLISAMSKSSSRRIYRNLQVVELVLVPTRSKFCKYRVPVLGTSENLISLSQ